MIMAEVRNAGYRRVARKKTLAGYSRPGKDCLFGVAAIRTEQGTRTKMFLP